MRKATPYALALLGFLLGAVRVLGEGPSSDTSPDRAMEKIESISRFTEVAISPDGKRIAWVEDLQQETRSPSPLSAIYVLDVGSPSATPRRISAGKGAAPANEHDLAWSPDSNHLAFLSDAEKPTQPQLYSIDTAGGAATKLTNLTGALAMPRWSPDSKVVALLFTPSAQGVPGPLEPRPPDTGVVEEHVYEQRIISLQAGSGQVRFISPNDLYVYEYDWSPDGKSFAAIAAHGAGDNNWWIAQLYVISAGSGETRPLTRPSMQIARPRWSPDGKLIAFIGGLMSDAVVPAGDIFVVPSEGGAPRNITPGMEASAGWLAWLPSSHQILFASYVDGASGIETVDSRSSHVAKLWTGAETIEADDEAFTWSPSLALARDAKTVGIIRHSFGQPPEVWTGAMGAWKQITHMNADLRPRWGQARSLHWTSDGMRVQGWLLYPLAYNPNRRYPMVVFIHGGPAWATRPAWPNTFLPATLFSTAGYFVLLPNPRGSYGQGELFTRANVKDFGRGDLRDILAGVKKVTDTLPVDPLRIGITGWSYGGYMTMWAITQTRAFHAAVAGAGIANWQSYYGQNGIDQWMIPYFGTSVYDDPAVYAQSSPITFIKNAETPTLILVGERDTECPAPQSYEFWHALRTLGVKTQFVIYPGEGHLILEPEHRRDISRRAIAWFDEHLRQNEQ